MLRLVAATLLALLALLAALVAPSPAYAEDADTTPPRVVLDPCPDQPVGEACTRRAVAHVVQEVVAEGEGLAVAGVREGEVVLSERTYDDGSGFVPYGVWVPPGSDVGSEVDYATEAWLGPGLHELTFYARDLAGNEATVTRTVHGPGLPGKVRRVRTEQGSWGSLRALELSWTPPRDRGAAVSCYRVRVSGRKAASDCGSVPAATEAVLVDVERGRHVVRIRAGSIVGFGAVRRLVVHVR